MARQIKNNQPSNFDEALYLLDRGKLRVPGVRTREAAVAKLKEEYGEDGSKDYSRMKVARLNEIIDERNADRDENDYIVPDGDKKADLIAALEADDEDDFLGDDD